MLISFLIPFIMLSIITVVAKHHSLAPKLIHRAKLSVLIPDETKNIFLVNISIGQPPVSQLLALDTTTNLLWVQCVHCSNCFNQSSPIFNPSKSSTYTNITCESSYCEQPIVVGCDLSDSCSYAIPDEDNTITEGHFATEMLTFTTSDGGMSSVLNIVFGCADNNKKDMGKRNGVLGVGPDESNISLPFQLGSKLFSYCIGDINDPHYDYNQLIIGDQARIEGYSTPLEIHGGLYYLNLEAIRVGEKTLDISPGTFERDSMGNGGVVIDTTSTQTYLSKGGFEPLSAEVQDLIGGLLKRVVNPKRADQLCYNGILIQELTGFPVVTFQFVGGAELVLDITAMFRQHSPNIFCMELLVSNNQRSSVGIMAQQHYNIGYDLGSMKIYFQRIDCDLFED